MVSVLDETLDQMTERLGNRIRAIDAYFAVHGNLPPEKSQGEYYEAVGDPGLGEDVELYIKSNFSR